MATDGPTQQRIRAVKRVGSDYARLAAPTMTRKRANTANTRADHGRDHLQQILTYRCEMLCRTCVQQLLKHRRLKPASLSSGPCLKWQASTAQRAAVSWSRATDPRSPPSRRQRVAEVSDLLPQQEEISPRLAAFARRRAGITPYI